VPQLKFNEVIFLDHFVPKRYFAFNGCYPMDRGFIM